MNNLEEITCMTMEELKKLDHLNLSKNNLTKIPPDISQLTALTELDLSENQISEISPEIRQLTALTKLNLSENQISEIPPEIGQLTALTELDLSKKQISEIPPDISQLTDFTLLDLFRNQISEIPPEISQLTALTKLDLSGNQISEIPPEISQLTALIELDLSGNQISEIPPDISQLKALTKLDLSGNQISEIPPEIGQLKALTELNLSKKQTFVFLSENGELTAFTSLDPSGNQISEIPPEIGQLKALTSLDLSGNQISVVPPEIGQLKALTWLDLSGNQISVVPPEIGQLMALTSLDLSGNQISVVSPEIGQLTALTWLVLSGNQISVVPPEIGQLTALTSLDLSGNQISVVSPEIGQLTALTWLVLSGNQISVVPPEIGQLMALTELDLSENQISEIPPEISQLTALTSLVLSRNKISVVPPEISQLTALTFLVLSRNQISVVPPEIGQLTALTWLDLSGNQISVVPPEIDQLTALTWLDLSGNQISVVPPEIGQLTALTKLDLSGNQISVVPPEIGQLTALTKLDLSGNQISVVPPEIGQLTALTKLDLSGNQISVVPPEIGQLTTLTELNLSRNQISVVPPEIGQLTTLTELNLSRNHFIEFSTLVKNLPRLVVLDISNCVINQLPIEILYQDLPFWDKYSDPYNSDSYGNNKGVFIKGLRLLTQPVSLFLKDKQLIMAYFKEAKIQVNDTKVIFLGDGNAGKTYTMERIKGNGKKGDYPTSETHGILITPRTMVSDGKQYNIRFWDFGVQHIMRSMHRCFLSERTCYVVVVSTRLGSMMDQARRWLKTIASFAKGSPVLLVINLIDNDPYRGFAENRIYEEFQDKLDIKGIVHLSVMDASDDEFNYTILKSIKDMALAMDSIEMLFPKSWNDIREELFKETTIEGQYYITQERFQEICRNNHLYEEDIQQWLLDWFNDLGYCVSYGKDIRLSEYKVLNPEWITNAIYILLTSDRVMADNGIVWRSNIETVLKNPSGGTAPEIDHYEPDECEYILEVMRKFELSYKISDNQEFLPALCDENITVDPPNKYRSHVASSMVYEFLPENVIHKFMVRSYGRLVRNCCTSKKVMIRDELSALTAILDAGKGDDTLHIDIYAQGDRHPSELLGWIRNEINDINHDLNISAEEYIFINQEEGSIAVRELIDKRELERRENPGRPPRYQGRKAYFFIDELLGELFGDEIVQTAMEVISTPDSKFDSLTPELLLSLTSEDERAHIIRKLRPSIVNVFGDMVLGEKTTTVHNGPSVEDITNLIEVIATEKEASYEFIAKLLDANSNLATAYMEATKQGKKGKLYDMLSNAANLATLGQVISSIPKLASNPAVQQFIETISHFVK